MLFLVYLILHIALFGACGVAVLAVCNCVRCLSSHVELLYSTRPQLVVSQPVDLCTYNI